MKMFAFRPPFALARHFLICMSLLFVAAAVAGCETIGEGEPCDDLGEYHCTSSEEVLRCSSSSDGEVWKAVDDCGSGECQLSGSSYDCVASTPSESGSSSNNSSSGDCGGSPEGTEICGFDGIERCSSGEWAEIEYCDTCVEGSGEDAYCE